MFSELVQESLPLSYWKVLFDAVVASTVMPAPLAPAFVLLPLATVMFLSVTSSVAEFTVVVVPDTVKLPDTVTSVPDKEMATAPVEDLMSLPVTVKSPATVTSDAFNVNAVAPVEDLMSLPFTVRSPFTFTSEPVMVSAVVALELDAITN